MRARRAKINKKLTRFTKFPHMFDHLGGQKIRFPDRFTGEVGFLALFSALEGQFLVVFSDESLVKDLKKEIFG